MKPIGSPIAASRATVAVELGKRSGSYIGPAARPLGAGRIARRYAVRTDASEAYLGTPLTIPSAMQFAIE